MNPKSIFILTSLTLSIGVGCTHKNAPEQPRAEQFESAQIHVDSMWLRRETYVGEPKVDRDESGNLLHVQIPIRSAIHKTLYVDYFVTFFDERGHVLSKSGPFTKTLQSNTPDYIEFNSMSPRAADFQVDLRYAR